MLRLEREGGDEVVVQNIRGSCKPGGLHVIWVLDCTDLVIFYLFLVPPIRNSGQSIL